MSKDWQAQILRLFVDSVIKHIDYSSQDGRMVIGHFKSLDETSWKLFPEAVEFIHSVSEEWIRNCVHTEGWHSIYILPFNAQTKHI